MQCLVVFVPGFLDGPDTFMDHGFPSDVITRGAPCDSVAIDLHYRYYWESPTSSSGVANVVFDDILEPAAARGYQEIWLVGISMGGLGALLTAERHPELVTGVILLAPFVGEDGVVREIIAAGGPLAWHPPRGIDHAPWTQDNYTAHLWAWLRGYATDADAMPPLYIGWGEGDRLGEADRLLASMQPADHVVTVPGAHNWETWRPLFDTFLDRARPGR
jgi:pimeloyl-ACP methyl ester carboxylesterase